jgi:hypothetical protein
VAGTSARSQEETCYRFCPVAGGALIFSCSLIHEPLPVTEGERFVLLNICRQKPRAKAADSTRVL